MSCVRKARCKSVTWPVEHTSVGGVKYLEVRFSVPQIVRSSAGKYKNQYPKEGVRSVVLNCE